LSIQDSHGRKVNYLRLSITDRCNLRCRYCMPAAGVARVDHTDILRYEELLLLARAAASIGIEKIRLTGGEPLVRGGVVNFLQDLGKIEGLRHMVLTTNGTLLGKMARPIAAAGVKRINISLDSLSSRTFAQITRGGDVREVFRGIAAALSADIKVKLNVVVMRGINDHEVENFAALTAEMPVSVRFIEYMPNLQLQDWRERHVPSDEIVNRLAKNHSLVPACPEPLSGPARIFKIPGALGHLGLITPVSGHFCSSCNRIRIAANGTARSCLFGPTACDLKPVLRSGNLSEVRRALEQVILGKPASHHLGNENPGFESFSMAQVGG